jgi:two-component system, chemotaxis family, response regulator PixG
MPISILEESIKAGNACLRVNDGKIDWIFYIASGKIAFASNSIDSFERLDRHLKRLSHEVPNLPKNLSSELRLNFEADFPRFSDRLTSLVPDYLAICFLAAEAKLTLSHIRQLAVRQTQEVLEMFLALPQFTKYETKLEPLNLHRLFCQLSLESVVKVVSNRLIGWDSLAPVIQSPYEIPYIASEATACKYMAPEAVKKLHKTLRGFNFRQLGALYNQDDLAIAKKLYPLVKNNAIYLREPIAPFDLLPLTSQKNFCEQPQPAAIPSSTEQISGFTSILGAEADQPPRKIVCVDDSQAMLREIERLLEGNQFLINVINDSAKALMKMASIKPDLILLDVGMPNVDGYQLCTLIRKSSMLKDTPVVMVTGNKGLIDRARAKIVGATDFLAKPFTQQELLKIVFRYLT